MERNPFGWLFVMGVGAVSVIHALSVLTSAELDEASSIPGYQRWIAAAGVLAAAIAVVLCAREEEFSWGFVTVVVLIGVFCALPWWHQRSTVDVTTTGFHRAAYKGYWSDLYVYNDTDAPVVVHGRTIRRVRPHHRVALKWPPDLYGTFTLTVTGPLAPGARGSTTVTREELPHRPTV